MTKYYNDLCMKSISKLLTKIILGCEPIHEKMISIQYSLMVKRTTETITKRKIYFCCGVKGDKTLIKRKHGNQNVCSN